MSTVIRLLRLTEPTLPRLALAVVAGTLAGACGIGLMATSAWLIARAGQHPPVLELGVAIVAVRAFGLSRGFARYGERLAGHDSALRVLGRLRVRSYESVIPQTAIARGDALQRFASDVDAGQDLLVRVLLPYASALLAALGAVVLLGVLVPAGGLVLAAMVCVVAFVAPAMQQAVASSAQARTAPLRAQLTGGVVELLHALPDLVAFGRATTSLDRLRATDSRLRAALARTSAGVGIGNAITVVAGGACVWLALMFGVRQGLDSPALAVVVLTPLAVLDVLAVMPDAAARVRPVLASLRRVFEVLDAPDPVPNPAPPRLLPDGPYHLRAEGLSAWWHGGTATVLDAVSLDLPPGRRVALVGPSGCGKTTLAFLLMRFLDPVAGRVTLNGVDLRELASDDVRRVVSLMDDSAHCFDTTIAGNLRVAGPDATDEQLWDVLRRARLADWVAGLPLGLATPVGEYGGRLSGGQRRRLALARVLLAGAPILILDEPTEHLDEETAAALTADLLAATGDRTLLLITHRPFGLSEVDDIVHLGQH
jgi:thiol reductant ABC exporter CydC subunit